jgi:hypothetical protein
MTVVLTRVIKAVKLMLISGRPGSTAYTVPAAAALLADMQHVAANQLQAELQC